jgi:hypothetical protein
MEFLINPKWARITAAAIVATLSLTGCLSEEETDSSFTEPPVAEPPANSPPRISGSPPGNVDVGERYSFTPSAADDDGDSLTFSISSQPSWASFDSSSGRLSGTPSLGDAGTDSGIVITVSDGTDSSSLPAFSITVNTVATNSPPAISGTPATSVTVEQSYSFTPTATDADGDSLTFSVSGLPNWASFAANTGALTGTPQAADVGVYANIVISVSDGQESTSLPEFSITVDAISLGSATLSWSAPTENEDGTTLTDLAGYKLYWGTTPGTYTDSATIDNPSITTYVVDNLAPGTYEFVATAYNADGVESRFSGTATKVIE